MLVDGGVLVHPGSFSASVLEDGDSMKRAGAMIGLGWNVDQGGAMIGLGWGYGVLRRRGFFWGGGFTRRGRLLLKEDGSIHIGGFRA